MNLFWFYYVNQNNTNAVLIMDS